MKTITFYSSLFLFFLSISLQAQTASQALDEVINSTEIIVESAEDGQTTLYSLTVNYFYYNNPAYINTYISNINQAMEGVEEYFDEVIYYTSIAAQANPDLDTSSILSYANTIEPNEDLVLNLSASLQSAVNAHNNNQVYALILQIKSVLNDIIFAAEEANSEAYQLLNSLLINTYNVKIELVHYQSGLPVNPGTLPGYVVTDLETGIFYYAGEQQTQAINEFIDLPEGTYRFDAYDGYFDGASSKTVTLSNEPVGADGFITVTLTYWSE